MSSINTVICTAFVEAGGLVSYGPSLPDLFVRAARAATYVDKILKGAKPADLPIEQPTKFELVGSRGVEIDALGLTVGREFLLRADEVIHPADGALYRAGAGSVQGFLAIGRFN
jgi:ABC-type uncharacterized transport system substrate-binding protein